MPAIPPDHAARIRQLEVENTQLRRVLDHMPSMIGYWGNDQRNHFGNRAYLDWFGIDPATMPGKHIREVIGEERYRLNLPYIEGVLRGEAQEFERAIPTPDGKEVRHSLASYIPDLVDGRVQGFFVLVTDASSIREAQQTLEASEARLRQSEERYRTVLQDQTELITRLRQDGIFLYANEAYCRFFGKTQEELIGQHWMPVCHADDLPHVLSQVKMLSPETPVVVIENRVYSATGALHWFQFVNRGFFDTDGRLREIQAVGRDISERKQIEAALRESRDQLELRVVERTAEVRRLAMESVRIESRERQSIARDLHDNLGQLLHVARIKLDVMAPRIPPEAAPLRQELHDLLAACSRQVRTLTAQLSPPVLRKLGLVPALHWLVGEMERQYGLRVALSEPATAVGIPRFHAEILFHAIRELLINVVKHSGTLQAKLLVECGPKECCVIVEDSGRGKPGNEIVEGTGFGLLSIRERIAYLDGSIDIVAAKPRGLRAVLRVPIAAVPMTAEAAS